MNWLVALKTFCGVGAGLAAMWLMIWCMDYLDRRFDMSPAKKVAIAFLCMAAVVALLAGLVIK